MRQIRRNVAVCLLAAGSALFLTGCPQQETAPVVSEEKPAYKPASEIVIEIQGFDFTDGPGDGSASELASAVTQAVAVAASATGTAAAGEGADEWLAEEEVMGGPQPTRRGTVMFDLLVRFAGQGKAPEGVDVEFVQLGADGNEKGRYEEWVVTHGLAPGAEQRDFLEFEVDLWEDGDFFSVSLPGIVPADPRGFAAE